MTTALRPTVPTCSQGSALLCVTCCTPVELLAARTPSGYAFTFLCCPSCEHEVDVECACGDPHDDTEEDRD